MTSIFIQIILALTVLMPPGTYRTLQMLASQGVTPSSVGRSGASYSDQKSPAVNCGESTRDRVPTRARNWSQVTFTFAEHWEGRLPPSTDAVCYLVLETEGPEAGSAPMHGHERHPALKYSSPRAALLALQKLLS